MHPRLKLLLVSFFFAYFTIFFITPYLSINVLDNYENQSLLISSIIYAIPTLAQVLTLHFFNNLAAKRNLIRPLIILGYASNIIQYIILYFVIMNVKDALLVMVVTFIINLFTAAYIPSTKAFLSFSSPQEKGKILGYFNIIMTMCFGLGYLIGGILYDIVNFSVMVIMAVGFSITSLILLVLVPKDLLTIKPKPSTPKKIPDLILNPIAEKQSKEGQIEEKQETQDIHKESLKAVMNFKGALWFQFFLRMFSSLFFSLFGPYLLSIHISTSILGISNALSAICGIIGFAFFSRLLDKKGPNFLFWSGCIMYLMVFFGLLTTTNVIAIMIMWSLPAYTFYIGVEYIACQTNSKTQAIQNMAKANFSLNIAVVFGQLLGGFMATIATFQAAMWTGFLGTAIITIFLGIFTITIKLKKSK